MKERCVVWLLVSCCWILVAGSWSLAAGQSASDRRTRPGDTTGAVQFNNAGRFGGAVNLRYGASISLVFVGQSAPSLSGSGQGSIYFDSTSNKFRVSEHGGAYVDLVGGGGAPTGATYVTVAADATLSAERTLAGTASQITVTDNGANSTVVLSTPQNISTSSAVTFASLNLGGATVLDVLTATASLDFPSVAIGACSDLTIAVAGAAVGDAVVLGIPNASIFAVGTASAFTGWVSAAGTVTVRYCNADDLASSNLAAGTFRAVVIQF